MTTWTNATEAQEYVTADYVVDGYILPEWGGVTDGTSPTWTNATEAATVWTNQ